MLKEVFKIQHQQIQGMVASQNPLATAISLPRVPYGVHISDGVRCVRSVKSNQQRRQALLP